MISYTFRNLVQQTHQIIFFYPRVLWKEDDSITILALISRFSNTHTKLQNGFFSMLGNLKCEHFLKYKNPIAVVLEENLFIIISKF